jgi:hypothetical protein
MMMTYRNQTPENASKLNYRELLEATVEMLKEKYPKLERENAIMIADLMVRYDEDVLGDLGQYRIASEASHV